MITEKDFHKFISDREKIGYIRGFADGDGSVSKYRKDKHYNRMIELVNTEKGLLLKIQQYLTELGIESKLTSKKVYQKNHKQAYQLRISRRRNLKLWQKKIGFNHLKKKQRLEILLKSYKTLSYTWWTLTEREEALKMQRDGYSNKQIAKHFNRTYMSTCQVLSKIKRGIYK